MRRAATTIPGRAGGAPGATAPGSPQGSPGDAPEGSERSRTGGYPHAGTGVPRGVPRAYRGAGGRTRAQG